jgi:hypothetical protein
MMCEKEAVIDKDFYNGRRMEQKLQRMMCEKEAVIDEILTQLQQEGCGRGVYSRWDGEGGL